MINYSMAYLRTITTTFPHFLFHSPKVFAKRRGINLFESFIKQYSSAEPELIHGTRNWRMIRPATSDECSYDTFHRNYTRQAIGGFVVNSRKPFNEEIWREAMRLTTKKLEVLRLCLHDRGDGPWLCEVHDHDIDFKVTENKTVLDVVEEMKNEGIDNSFWSVRVVPADHGEVYPIPHLKVTFPHQCHFLWIFHHGVLDGQSLAYCMRIYIQILDDVLSGKTVKDIDCFAKYMFDDPLHTKIKQIQQALENNPTQLNEEKERLLKLTMKQPILYSAYPKPKGVESTTHYIVREVDNAKVNKLYNSCKLNNIGMTAGFEAVFNTALVEMVRDAGDVKDGYKINIRQIINTRRYMELNSDFMKFPPLGPIQGRLHQGTYCKKEARRHFWEHAEEIHKDFHSLLKNNGPIVENIVRPQVVESLSAEMLAKTPQDSNDYAFSNIMDLTSLVFHEGTQVQTSSIIVYNFVNNFLHPMIFQYNTYRGFGQLVCCYDTAKVADDTAHELVDRIMNVLDFVSK